MARQKSNLMKCNPLASSLFCRIFSPTYLYVQGILLNSIEKGKTKFRYFGGTVSIYLDFSSNVNIVDDFYLFFRFLFSGQVFLQLSYSCLQRNSNGRQDHFHFLRYCNFFSVTLPSQEKFPLPKTLSQHWRERLVIMLNLDFGKTKEPNQIHVISNSWEQRASF